MTSLTKSSPLGTLGLPAGDHLVRFHVEAEVISFEIAVSTPLPQQQPDQKRIPTGFVNQWGSTVTKEEATDDAWLAHINDKHLR